MKIKGLVSCLMLLFFACSAAAQQEDLPHSSNPNGTNVFQKRKRVYQKKNKVTQQKKPVFSKKPPEAKVFVKTDISETAYKIVAPDKLKCGTIMAAGCTHGSADFKIRFEYTPENMIKNIHLTLSFSGRIDISSDYPKGSCYFDHILKHELTHDSLNRKIFNAYLQEFPKTVLAKLDTLPQPLASDGYNELYAAINGVIDRMYKEQEKQHSFLDGEENYAYQWKQAAEICSRSDGNEKLKEMFIRQMEQHPKNG